MIFNNYCASGYSFYIVIYFVLNHLILIRKYFFTPAYFSSFDLESSLNQKLSSLRAKACFCD